MGAAVDSPAVMGGTTAAGPCRAADVVAGTTRCHNRRVRRVLIYGDVVVFLAAYGYCVRHYRADWRYLLGMALATAGYALWFIARAQLGRSFTPRPEARELVTTGLYSRFRNPIYVFSTVGLSGLCLAMRWYAPGAVYLLVVSLIQWRRARVEAAVLEEKFGDRYRQYRARTWF